MLEEARVLEADPLGRSEALRLAGGLCSVLPSAKASTVDLAAQIDVLAQALMRFPAPIARVCAGLDGLLGSEQWRPVPATVVEWCEKRVQALRTAAGMAERVLEHRASLRAPAPAAAVAIDGESERDRRARIAREVTAAFKRDLPPDPLAKPIPQVPADDAPIVPSAELINRVKEMQG